MSKKEMRRVSRDSRYNRTQDLFAEAYGPLVNEGSEWTNEQINDLLDGFLVKELRYLSAKDCLRKITGRSVTAVSTMIWKLAINYDRASVRNYNYQMDVDRKMRVCDPWTVRDKAIIEMATGQEGQLNKAHGYDHLAKILARSPEEIHEFFLECRAHVKNQFAYKFVSDYKRTESLATTVNRVVHGSHKRLMQEIGL